MEQNLGVGTSLGKTGRQIMWVTHDYLSRVMRKPVIYPGFPTRSDTNRAVQTQKMARDLKFRI